MAWLELRIPPLVLVVLFACVMAAVAVATPQVGWRRDGLVVAGVLVAVVGVLVCVAGVVGFRNARTTVNPVRPQDASTLVTSGIYAYSRNPMYLGFLLVLLGWAVGLGSPLALLVALLFIPCMNRWQIVPEERVLQGMFGRSFLDYRTGTRRWI